MSELKACPNPWCGKDFEPSPFHYEGGKIWWCVCHDCGITSTSCKTKHEAITAWNTRPDEGPRESLIRPDVVESFYFEADRYLNDPDQGIDFNSPDAVKVCKYIDKLEDLVAADERSKHE